MVKLRFHLGAGEHFRQWQVRHDDGRVEYHDPASVVIRLDGCRLHNQRGTAERIHDGENKRPCAWVEAESITVCNPTGVYHPRLSSRWVGFNPRTAPHWTDAHGGDLDGAEFATVVTDGRDLLAWANR